MLVQLGVFRTLGRFLPIEKTLICVIDYLAREFDVETPFRLSASTVYRHQRAVLAYVGVTAWNDEARQLTEVTMMKMAEARTDPADLINAAIDVLVRHPYELPALRELRRLAGTAHHAINEGQWQQVYAQLKDGHRAELEALLEVAPDAR